MAEGTGFDREGLVSALARHGRVVRVVVAAFDGSAPREAGAAMLVWADGQQGTIGGGALEHQAIARARALLADGRRRGYLRVPLGPGLGQCCGGAVTLVSELFEAADPMPEDLLVRAVAADAAPDMPLSLRRLVARARDQGQPVPVCLLQGWLLEPVAQVERLLWIWGAGHVGRALVAVMAPLPGVAITWVDTARARFPGDLPEGVTALPVADAAALADHAPREAEHLVLTFSHALDLDICHRLLRRGFRHLGLIGSATKAARFRARLHELGHLPTEIAQIACPIGDKSLGKHPQSIALGVALEFQRRQGETVAAMPGRFG